MLGKGYAAEDVDQALGMLVEQGLQSDRRFAESFLRGRLMRGQGPVKMLAELGQRGIDRTLAREALAEVEREESVDWYRLASEVLERRFGREVPGRCQGACAARTLSGRTWFRLRPGARGDTGAWRSLTAARQTVSDAVLHDPL